MVDNEHLKYTTTLLLYNFGMCRLTDDFFRDCYLNFIKFTVLGLHVIALVKTFPLMNQLPM